MPVQRKFWILINPKNWENDRELLESLGVIVGWYNRALGGYTGCIISKSAWQKLDKYWGRFYWGPDEHSRLKPTRNLYV